MALPCPLLPPQVLREELTVSLWGRAIHISSISRSALLMPLFLLRLVILHRGLDLVLAGQEQLMSLRVSVVLANVAILVSITGNMVEEVSHDCG